MLSFILYDFNYLRFSTLKLGCLHIEKNTHIKWVPVSSTGKVSNGLYKRFEVQSLSTRKID